MTGVPAERPLLAVALGSAAGAYSATFVGRPGIAMVVAGFGTLVWLVYRNRGTQRPSPLLAALVRILLLTTGLVAVFSRNVPLLAEGVATTSCLVTGGLLVACAPALAWYGPGHPRHAGLVPVALGILVAAAVQPGTRQWFVALACIAGTSLWVWALAVGGPRHRLLPLALFVLLGAGLALGTALFLPWAQPHVEEWAAALFADGQSGLSAESVLGDIASLAVSRRIVARVWTTRPQLLRMEVFEDFDGKRWSARLPRPRKTAPDPSGGPRVGPLLAATPGFVFTLSPSSLRAFRQDQVVETRVMPSLPSAEGWGLLVPQHPTVARMPVEQIRIADDTGIIDVGAAADPPLYGVVSGPPSSPPAAPPADDPTREPLSDPRIRELAARLGAAGASPREKLDRTLAFLGAYRYTLEGLPSSLDDFLFEKKAGYCEFFATAAAMLLRQQGVAARYVKGVRVDPESRIGDHYVVRESDAHAWIEAYLPGEGWVEADPTPSGTRGLDGGHPSRIEEGWEGLQTWLLDHWIRVREDGWEGLRSRLATALEDARAAMERRSGVVASGLAGLVAALLAWRFRRRVLRPRSWVAGSPTDDRPVPIALRDRIRAMERRWARLGRRRPASVGLREHLESLPTDVLGPEEREESARLVATYYAVRFGGQSLADDLQSDLAPPASVSE